MTPYSHLVVASKLASLVGPEDLPEYYWGAMVPDIRYLASMRRQQTHLETREILALRDRYPHLGSFIQGYLVHCLADQIDLSRMFFRHLPFSMLKQALTHQHLAVLLQLYYLETETVRRPVSGTYNEVLAELGLSQAMVARYAEVSKAYAAPDFQGNLRNMADMLGLAQDSRIKRYVSAAKRFQSSWALKNALFVGIRAGQIDKQIVAKVASLYRRSGMGLAD